MAYALPHVLISFLLVGPAPLAGAAQGKASGIVDGRVTAAVTEATLEGAQAQIEGTGLSALSDGSGYFRFGVVPVGTHRIVVSYDRYVPTVVADVVVTQGRVTSVLARLQESVHLTEDVSVQASYFDRPEGVTTGAYSMSYDEVRRAPGAVGDVGRMIQSLPAAVVRDDSRNDIVARGGSPSENLILVDNIEVPNLSHFGGQGASGGPVTMLNAETISDVRFLAGGFPAAYGNRLSSVLEISLREGSRERFQAEVDAGMAGAGVMLEGPLGGSGSWLVSGRRSFVDLIAGAWNITAVPQYANGQLKAVYDIGTRHRLSLIGLGGWDTIDFDVDHDDLDDTNTFDIEDVGWRGVVGLDWRALLGKSGVSNLSISHAENDFSLRIWDTQLDDALIEQNRSRERETTIREDLSWRLGRHASLRAGAFAKRLGGSFDITAPLGQENPFSAGEARMNALAFDETVATWIAGGHLELRPRLGSWATASLGGRVDRYQLNRVTKISPRAGLTFHLHPSLDLSASYGRYYQNPPLVLMRAFPGNANLTAIRSDHSVVGLSFRPKPDLQLSVEAYRKRSFDYPVSTQFPSLTSADSGEQFDIGPYMLPYVSQGRGRGDGIEVHIHKKLSGRVWGQLGYAHSRTKNQALDVTWRPSTFDLPHVLSVVAGVKATRSIDLSTKFTYTSGRPSTPLLPESYQQNRLILDIPKLNSERMPAYHRLDLRLDHRETHRFGNIVYYLEVDNVYNRKNALFRGWNPKRNRPFTASQLTFIAIGGVNVEF